MYFVDYKGNNYCKIILVMILGLPVILIMAVVDNLMGKRHSSIIYPYPCRRY